MNDHCLGETNGEGQAHGVRMRYLFVAFILCVLAIAMLGWLAALYCLARAAFLWLLQ
jgi:hypothetical protein